MGVVMKVVTLLLLIAMVAKAKGRLDASSMVAEVMNDRDFSSLMQDPNVPCCSSCECTKSDPPQCQCLGSFRSYVCSAVCPGHCACNLLPEPFKRCVCGFKLPFCFPLCSAQANAIPTA